MNNGKARRFAQIERLRAVEANDILLFTNCEGYMNLALARELDRLSRVLLDASDTAGLPCEASCILAATAVEKGIESVLVCNKIIPVNPETDHKIFYEKFVLNGGFPRGIEKEIANLYKMRCGGSLLAADGGKETARNILKEIHRTVKGWILEESIKGQ